MRAAARRSRACAELAVPLTSCNALESWPHISPATALRRAGDVPQPDSTVELAMVIILWVSQSHGMRVGRELTPPLNFHRVAWAQR